MKDMSKLSNIMNISWEKLVTMNEQELRSIGQVMVSGMNKRLRRLEKSVDVKITPAYRGNRETGGDFSMRKQENRNEVLHEISRMKNFYGTSTGNVRGAKRYIENTKIELKESAEREGYDVDEDDAEEMLEYIPDSSDWEAYHKILESNPSLKRPNNKQESTKIKDEIMRNLAERKSKSKREYSASYYATHSKRLVDRINKEMTLRYEESNEFKDPLSSTRRTTRSTRR